MIGGVGSRTPVSQVPCAICDIVKLNGTSGDTLKPDSRKLVAQGHLALDGGGRGAWYALS
jgi:hypothetical protein